MPTREQWDEMAARGKAINALDEGVAEIAAFQKRCAPLLKKNEEARSAWEEALPTAQALLTDIENIGELEAPFNHSTDVIKSKMRELRELMATESFNHMVQHVSSPDIRRLRNHTVEPYDRVIAEEVRNNGALVGDLIQKCDELDKTMDQYRERHPGTVKPRQKVPPIETGAEVNTIVRNISEDA